MKHKTVSEYEPTPYIPELRERSGAVTIPHPTPEQIKAELEQIQLLEAAVNPVHR